MSIFVDTGVLFADHNHRDRHHAEAKAAMEAVVDGRWGAGVTSSFIYDETVTLMLSRTGRFEDAKAIGDRILGREPYPKVFTLLHVDSPRFQQAVDAFERYSDHGLSFTDAAYRGPRRGPGHRRRPELR